MASLPPGYQPQMPPGYQPQKLELWRKGLYYPHYTVPDAAHYAEIPPRTVSYWFRGGQLAPLGIPRGVGLNQFQLIEIVFVATFRNLGVPLRYIKKAGDHAAQALDTPHPFTQYQWMIKGPQILSRLTQAKGHAPIQKLITTDQHDQVSWHEQVADRFQQFDYEEGFALVWHPRGRSSPVKIDPRIRFGHPAIRGIPTSILKDRWIAGETVASVAKDYLLHADEVRAAWKFEGVEYNEIRWAG